MWDIFPADSTRAVIADWIELELVVSGRSFYTDSHLRRARSVEEEPDQRDDDRDEEADLDWQEFDPEILESDSDGLAEAVWAELELRRDHLKDCYPFELEALRLGGWRLSIRPASAGTTAYARSMYLTTLTMSAMRNHLIRKDLATDPKFDELLRELERLFQHVSALAASKYLSNETEVFSFGWPRQDGSPFHDALKNFVGKFGRGKVKKRIPASASGYEKDGTVDLIAWRKFETPSPVGPLLYGQVASGSNWKDKPVKAYVDGKFLHWFKKTPTTTYDVGTFMPFVKHTEVKPPRDGRTMEEAIHDMDEVNAKIYGHMFDRLRITELFCSGLGPEELRHLCEDPDDVLRVAEQWMSECFAYCA